MTVTTHLHQAPKLSLHGVMFYYAQGQLYIYLYILIREDNTNNTKTEQWLFKTRKVFIWLRSLNDRGT